jgi:hypothetical protein
MGEPTEAQARDAEALLTRGIIFSRARAASHDTTPGHDELHH